MQAMARKGLAGLAFSLGLMEEPPEDTLIQTWDIVYEGPYTEVLDYDELLYDPAAKKFQDGLGVIRRTYMTEDEFRNAAREANWNKIEVQRCLDAKETVGRGASDSLADDEREAVGSDDTKSFTDGKIMVCEFYIKTFGNEGRKKIRKYFLGE